MTLFILTSFAGACAGWILWRHNRSAQIKRYGLARGYLFEKYKNTLTTAQTAGRLLFFKYFFHLFVNVLTFSDTLAFLRLADDKAFADDNPATKPVYLTLFTAELRAHTFPPLRVQPQMGLHPIAQYPLLPVQDPALKHTFYAPSAQSGVLLTPFILRLLKERPEVYLEVNETAFLYHENRLIPFSEYPAFHLRAMQLLAELENLILHPATPVQAPQTDAPALQAPAAAEAEAQVATLLSNLSAHSSTAENAAGSMRLLLNILLLAALILLPLVAWLLLRSLLVK